MAKQNIDGLAAAYQAVYGRTLESRVRELVSEYGDRVGAVISELSNDCDATVPCYYRISELAAHYGIDHSHS